MDSLVFWWSPDQMQCNGIREEVHTMIRVFPDSASAPSGLLATCFNSIQAPCCLLLPNCEQKQSVTELFGNPE